MKKLVKIFYDWDTPNDSFVKMAYILKRKKIKNYNFFLKLYDKELVGVDPYDENLSEEMKARIQREVSKNFWYFIRECVKIAVPGRLKPFAINRGNLAMLWCLLNSINAALVLPRQNYKTQSACAFYAWCYNFSTENSSIAFFNKRSENCKENLGRMKRIIEELPPYLQLFSGRKDTINMTYMKNYITQNSVIAYGSANTEANADNLGESSPSINSIYCWKANKCVNRDKEKIPLSLLLNRKIKLQVNTYGLCFSV